MKRISSFFALVGIFAVLCAPVIGDSVAHAATCDKVDTSLVGCGDSTDKNPVMGMIKEITNFLAVGVGIAVVGGYCLGLATLYDLER